MQDSVSPAAAMSTPPTDKGASRFLDAPPELLATLWEYGLSAMDIAAASSSCRDLRGAMPKLGFLCAPDFETWGQYHGHFNREPYIDWSLEPLHGKLRSITMACVWHDQGWGNRKGHFVLQLVREDEVVAEAEAEPLGIAPHHVGAARGVLWSDNPVVSLARKGDHLRLLKVVGGGGGHKLTVREFKMLLVYESRQMTASGKKHIDVKLPGE